MLMRIGADQIGGAGPDRASGPTSHPALGSGGAERGIRTAGIQVGIPLGAPIRSVTTATGIAADRVGKFPHTDAADAAQVMDCRSAVATVGL
jgi:hypothetical protein